MGNNTRRRLNTHRTARSARSCNEINDLLKVHRSRLRARDRSQDDRRGWNAHRDERGFASNAYPDRPTRTHIRPRRPLRLLSNCPDVMSERVGTVVTIIGASGAGKGTKVGQGTEARMADAAHQDRARAGLDAVIPPSRLERRNGRIEEIVRRLAMSRCRSGVGSWLIP